MSFRSKKKESSIEIPNSAIKLSEDKKKVSLYSRYLSGIRLANDKCLETLDINHTCRLKVEKGKWYLFVPIKVEISEKVPEREFCALDPGVCNFQTVYSEETTLKVQVNKELFRKLQDKLDTFQSLRSKKLLSKSHYTRRINKLYQKTSNLIDDIHYKLIYFVTQNYQNIFLPTFESQEIVRKMKGKTSRRTLLSLKHFKFKERLRSKCSTMKHSAVYDCTEEYTSKTCGQCGKLNHDLKLQRCFECPFCGLKLDRDINGARNIAIKILCKDFP
jgi:putative transposase